MGAPRDTGKFTGDGKSREMRGNYEEGKKRVLENQ